MKTLTINLRAQPEQRSLIDQAAAVLGKSRSDFILDSSCRRAKDVLLNRNTFLLDDARMAEFMALLDKPVDENKALQTLLATKAMW